MRSGVVVTLARSSRSRPTQNAFIESFRPGSATNSSTRRATPPFRSTRCHCPTRIAGRPRQAMMTSSSRTTRRPGSEVSATSGSSHLFSLQLERAALYQPEPIFLLGIRSGVESAPFHKTMLHKGGCVIVFPGRQHCTNLCERGETAAQSQSPRTAAPLLHRALWVQLAPELFPSLDEAQASDQLSAFRTIVKGALRCGNAGSGGRSENDMVRETVRAKNT